MLGVKAGQGIFLPGERRGWFWRKVTSGIRGGIGGGNQETAKAEMHKLYLHFESKSLGPNQKAEIGLGTVAHACNPRTLGA